MLTNKQQQSNRNRTHEKDQTKNGTHEIWYYAIEVVRIPLRGLHGMTNDHSNISIGTGMGNMFWFVTSIWFETINIQPSLLRIFIEIRAHYALWIGVSRYFLSVRITWNRQNYTLINLILDCIAPVRANQCLPSYCDVHHNSTIDVQVWVLIFVGMMIMWSSFAINIPAILIGTFFTALTLR